MSARVFFDSTKLPLDELLKKAHEGQLQLPDFQRGWVWDDEGLRGVLASVSRSFPVGALMSLQTGGDVKFKPRLIEGAPERNAEASPDALLLDGQQRITSLYQTTMRKAVVETTNTKKQKIKRFFYIDMAAALDPTVDRLDSIIGVPESRIEKRNFGRDVVRDLSSREREFAQCMFPTNCVFDADAWQMGFVEHWGYDKEKMAFWFKFQNEILAAFKQYQMPVIQLGKQTSREAVCVVFEKVNTGGKKLDAFELLTAIYAGEDSDLLLRNRWEDCAKRLSDSIPLRDNPLTRVQPTEFFQALALLHTYDLRRAHGDKNGEGDAPPVSCTRDTVLRVPLAAYKSHAGRLESGFIKAGKFLFSQHIYWHKDVPYQSQLVPLAAILALIGDKWESSEVRKRLARWYWCGVFGELYGGATETRFARDLVDVVSWVDGGPEPATIRDSAFRAERLDTMTSRLSAAYKGVHALLMKHGARDFRSGQLFDHTTYFEEAADIHHIFPRAWCERNGIGRERYDTIINKTPLSYKTNRSIGGDAPSIYMRKIETNNTIDQDALNSNVSSNLIDASLLESNSFDEFVAARREALLALIEAEMGKTAYRGATSDEPEGNVAFERDFRAEA